MKYVSPKLRSLNMNSLNYHSRTEQLKSENMVLRDLLHRAPIMIEDWENIPEHSKLDLYNDVQIIFNGNIQGIRRGKQ
jgi:hypothetical protein